jgi:hypothetical protein
MPSSPEVPTYEVEFQYDAFREHSQVFLEPQASHPYSRAARQKAVSATVYEFAPILIDGLWVAAPRKFPQSFDERVILAELREEITVALILSFELLDVPLSSHSFGLLR